MLWGVAGGLAAHLGFSAVLVRIAFVLTTFFGGAGLLAYLVLAVALPEDDGEGNPVPESVWARLGKVVLICFLVGLALFAAAGLAVGSAWVDGNRPWHRGRGGRGGAGSDARGCRLRGVGRGAGSSPGW